MGLTIVLSGPAANRAQAVAALKQAGFEVEDSEHGHGFEPEPERTFITVHGGPLDSASSAVRHLDWRPRSHWTATGDWQKVPGVGSPLAVDDPMKELAKLKAQLRAQGIELGD